ncbi:MAG: hypothetical protein ACE5HT_03730 [Gemmatimonadales bacterium]
MVKQLGWLSLFALAVACTEDIAAPGACPEFCPSTQIRVIDTILSGIVERDSSFRGYVTPQQASQMQLVSDGTISSRAMIKFLRFDDSVALSTFGSDKPVVATDSFQITLNLERRSATDSSLSLTIHRIPVGIDSTTTSADLDPFFSDSTLIARIPLADTVTPGPLTVILPPTAFPALATDSLITAIGIAVESQNPAFAEISANGSGNGASIKRWIQVDSADGVTAQRTESQQVDFDSFTTTSIAPPGSDALFVGGSPSARALLRVNAPAFIVDTSNVIRATLIMVPSEPVIGPPGDTVRVQAESLVSDFGPKSPIVPLPSDSLLFGSALLPVGSTDTVRIDITHIVLPWRNNPMVPRSFMLRVTPEGSGIGEYRFNSSRAAFGRPQIQFTFIPPAGSENR